MSLWLALLNFPVLVVGYDLLACPLVWCTAIHVASRIWLQLTWSEISQTQSPIVALTRK